MSSGIYITKGNYLKKLDKLICKIQWPIYLISSFFFIDTDILGRHNKFTKKAKIIK